jgi:hypothetical protein
MPRPALTQLFQRIAADADVSAGEALEIRQAVFPDGVVDRAEAEALIALAGRVANGDAGFIAAFVEAVGDHVLGPDGRVDPADAQWLAARIAALPGDLGLETIVDVLRRAQVAPAGLSQSARDMLLKALSGRCLTGQDVGRIRAVLFASAGCGAVHVTLEEARFLFALDAACDGLTHDPSWPDLFEKAILNHVMAARAPALLDYAGMRDRRAWLEEKTAANPIAFLSRAFAGGLEGWRAAVRSASAVDAFERYYEDRVADAEDVAKLTLQEVAQLVAMVRADRKTTANERRLLDTLKAYQAAGGAAG